MAIPQSDNPKVALGFAGVVIAVLLVASVAYSELAGGSEETQEPAVAQQEAPAPAGGTQTSASAASFGSSQSSGWAGDEGVSEDWGVASGGGESSTPGPMEIPVEDSAAVGFGSQATQRSIQPRQPTSGPKVTTRAAPGAPKVSSPNAGSQPELTAIGG